MSCAIHGSTLVAKLASDMDHIPHRNVTETGKIGVFAEAATREENLSHDALVGHGIGRTFGRDDHHLRLRCESQQLPTLLPLWA